MNSSITTRKLFLKNFNQKRRRSKSESDNTYCASPTLFTAVDYQVDEPMHLDNVLNVKSNLEKGSLSDASLDQGSLNKEKSYFSEDEDVNQNDDVGYSSDESSVPEKTVNNKINHDKNNHQCPVVREKLRHWAITYTVLHVVLTALLLILRGIFPCLPANAKTLIKTENKFQIQPFFPENIADKSEFV